MIPGKRYCSIFQALALILIPVIYGTMTATADVLTTSDGIILNGKVIRKDNKVTVFSNFYGTFTIENSKIKALYETRKFEEDMTLMKNMGKEVNAKEVERNFQKGTENKISAETKEDLTAAPSTLRVKLALSSFFMFNMADLGDAVPWSVGGALAADFYFIKSLSSSSSYFIPEVRAEFSYLYADKGTKNLNGFGLTVGPCWQVPLGKSRVKPTVQVALMAGGGNYHVENSDESTRRFSINTVLHAGVSFTFGRVDVAPSFRYSYIHDSEAPLHSLGFEVGFGLRI